jgi:hypothetical protein
MIKFGQKNNELISIANKKINIGMRMARIT